jgi:hypothetical protein
MNKSIVTLVLFAAAVSFAPAATAQDGKKSTASTIVASPPKDAVRSPNGTYTWTDKQGKKWIYRDTGAGYARGSAEGVPASRIVEIPKDAVARPDGSYLWTDKAGKQWAFHRTPFGVLKDAVSAPAPAPEAVDKTTKVIDKGDTVRFERSSPFGVSSYEKKKSELNDDERRLYEASTKKSE